jgi:hypothetical protein
MRIIANVSIDYVYAIMSRLVCDMLCAKLVVSPLHPILRRLSMSEQRQVPQNADELTPHELTPDELSPEDLDSAAGGGTNNCPNYSNCSQN